MGFIPYPRSGVWVEPPAITGLVQIGRRVQGDRFQEDAHRPVHRRRAHAGPQHRGRVCSACRRGNDDARDVAKHADGVFVVEVPAEALLVPVALDADHHAVAILALREERQARSLAAQLVLGVVQVGQVLDLGDRHQP